MVEIDTRALLDEVRARKLVPNRLEAKAIRERAGVSQQRLADELGVHVLTVSRWENGTRHPRPEIQGRYAELLRALEAECQ